jgi:molecular chaperone IbpA
MTQLVRFDTNSINALNRALIGFDDVFSNFERKFANQVSNNYPPHNIIKTGENQYEIQVAVTGFSRDEVKVELDQNILIITAEKAEVEEDGKTYIHRGLAQRSFVRQFPLAEHIEVQGAEQQNGVLTIKLERLVPEAFKPRLIEISHKD